MTSKKIGIIGGGVIGTSIAHFLSTYEGPRSRCSRRTRSARGPRQVGRNALPHRRFGRHEFWDVRLFGFNFYTGLEREKPGSAGFEKTGTLVVCPYKEYETYVLKAVSLTLASGYHAEYWRDRDKIHKVLPDCNLTACSARAGARRRLLRRHDDLQYARSECPERGAQVLIGTKVEGSRPGADV